MWTNAGMSSYKHLIIILDMFISLPSHLTADCWHLALRTERSISGTRQLVICSRSPRVILIGFDLLHSRLTANCWHLVLMAIRSSSGTSPRERSARLSSTALRGPVQSRTFNFRYEMINGYGFGTKICFGFLQSIVFAHLIAWL